MRISVTPDACGLTVRHRLSPDLEELHGVGLVLVDEGEHLSVDDASAGCASSRALSWFSAFE